MHDALVLNIQMSFAFECSPTIRAPRLTRFGTHHHGVEVTIALVP